MKQLTGATIMPWFYILQKQKVCYLLLGKKNISFARFTLMLVLKTVILNKFMSTGTLALLLMINLAGDHTLLAFEKQFQKIFICCHNSDTLWTLLSASCFTMLIFPHTKLMHQLSGTAVVISYLTNLILFTEELQNWWDLPLYQPIQSYGTWEYFHSKKSLCSIRQY